MQPSGCCWVYAAVLRACLPRTSRWARRLARVVVCWAFTRCAAVFLYDLMPFVHFELTNLFFATKPNVMRRQVVGSNCAQCVASVAKYRCVRTFIDSGLLFARLLCATCLRRRAWANAAIGTLSQGTQRKPVGRSVGQPHTAVFASTIQAPFKQVREWSPSRPPPLCRALIRGTPLAPVQYKSTYVQDTRKRKCCAILYAGVLHNSKPTATKWHATVHPFT